MRVAPSPGMKHALLALSLLSLGGCGTIHNLGTGPQVYGGVRHDYASAHGCRGVTYIIDIPGSAILDTAFLPLTLVFEGIRCATGWPPKGVDP